MHTGRNRKITPPVQKLTIILTKFFTNFFKMILNSDWLFLVIIRSKILNKCIHKRKKTTWPTKKIEVVLDPTYHIGFSSEEPLESMNRVLNQCYNQILKTDQKSTNKNLFNHLVQETDLAFAFACNSAEWDKKPWDQLSEAAKELVIADD